MPAIPAVKLLLMSRVLQIKEIETEVSILFGDATYSVMQLFATADLIHLDGSYPEE